MALGQVKIIEHGRKYFWRLHQRNPGRWRNWRWENRSVGGNFGRNFTGKVTFGLLHHTMHFYCNMKCTLYNVLSNAHVDRWHNTNSNLSRNIETMGTMSGCPSWEAHTMWQGGCRHTVSTNHGTTSTVCRSPKETIWGRKEAETKHLISIRPGTFMTNLKPGDGIILNCMHMSTRSLTERKGMMMMKVDVTLQKKKSYLATPTPKMLWSWKGWKRKPCDKSHKRRKRKTRRTASVRNNLP